MTESEKILLDIQFDERLIANAIASVQEYREQINQLKDSQKQLASEGKQNTTEYIRQEQQIKALTASVRQNERILQANAKMQQKQNGHINELKNSIARLTAEYDSLSKEELENELIGGRLQKQIKAQSDELKSLKSAIGDNRLEVGNYKRGITDVLKEFQFAGINVGAVLEKLGKAQEDLFTSIVAGYKNAGLQAKLFGNAARSALTLTGIGLFIAGITALIAHWEDIARAIGLADDNSKSFFKTQQEGIERTKSLLEQYTKELEHQNELLKLQGKREDEIFDNRRKAALLNLANLKSEQQNLERIVNLLLKAVQFETGRIELSAFTKQEFDEIQRILRENEGTALENLKKFKTQYDDVSKSIVNAKNAMELLSKEFRKFTEENEKKGLADPKFSLGFREIIEDVAGATEALKDNNTTIKEGTLATLDSQKHAADLMTRITNQIAENNARAAQSYQDKANAAIAAAEREEAAMQATVSVFQVLPGLFKQNTAAQRNFAFASVAAEGGIAIARGVKTAMNTPFPANLAAILSTIAAVVSAISQARQMIGYALGGLVQPFARGGLTGTRIMPQHGTPIRRSNGDNLLATVKVGEVILNERQQALLGGANTFKRIGVPGFADGGFVARQMSNQVTESFDIHKLATAFSNSIRQLRIVTRITDIQKVQSKSASTQITADLR